MFENKSRTTLIVAVLVSVLGTLGAYWYFRPDPQMAKVEEMREQMRSEEMRNMTREQRREFFGQFRKEVEKLSIEQRRQLFANRRNPFRERLEKFFQASRKEQVAMLDQTIGKTPAAMALHDDAFRAGANGGVSAASPTAATAIGARIFALGRTRRARVRKERQNSGVIQWARNVNHLDRFTAHYHHSSPHIFVLSSPRPCSR